MVERTKRPRELLLDELLVMRCQDGEAAALDELVGRWQRSLWAYARRLTGDDASAWDAVQEAWLGIVRGIGRLDDPARFRPWAFRILTNKCADEIRRRMRSRRLFERIDRDAEPKTRPAGAAASGRVEILKAALRLLPGEQRAILSLRYAEDFSTAEIADVLGIPEGTVKSRLHHARNRLKDIMERTKP
ncbi:MAG: RNA polymerase sigma factor [Planctomycetota bacterium]|jgi:RNA polymerase sigma-70 factor (ECF subfamily)